MTSNVKQSLLVLKHLHVDSFETNLGTLNYHVHYKCYIVKEFLKMGWDVPGHKTT